MVTFKEIAQDIKEPGHYAEISDSMASLSLPGKESVLLIIGQKLSSAPAKFNQVYTAAAEETVVELTGEGSEIHRIAKYFFRNNAYNLVKFIVVEQKEGTPAAYNLAVTAENVKAGTLNLMFAANYVQVDVSEGDTAAEIADKLIEAVNDNPLIPVTAAKTENKTGEITLTAKHSGECGNNLPFEINYYDSQKTADGVSLTFSEAAKGTGNASLIGALASLGDEYFTDGITTYGDEPNQRLIRSIMDERFTAQQHNGGNFYFAYNDTFSGYITKANSINAASIVLLPSAEVMNMPEELAAAAVGNIAFRTQNTPALAYGDMKLKGILPAKNKAFIFKERNLLLKNGVSTLKADNSGNVYLSRVVTTRTKRDNGIKFDTFLDLYVYKAVIYLRYSYLIFMAENFPDFKLAEDSFEAAAGQSVATPSSIRAAVIIWAKRCQKAAIIQKIDDFVERLIVNINDQDHNRSDILMQPTIIGNFLVSATQIQPIV